MNWGLAAVLLIGVQDVLFAMFVNAMKEASKNMGATIREVIDDGKDADDE